ncbi:TolC family protein [bacterium]|jgi:outer membrane protein TolC|nr:TolC family protein [bacterium]
MFANKNNLKKLIAVAVVLAYLATPSQLFSQSVLLQEFIAESLKDHPLVVKSALDYWIEAEKVNGVQAIDDWNLSLSSDITRGLGSQGFNSFSSDGIFQTISTTGSRVYSSTGTRLSTGISYSGVSDQPSFGGFATPDSYRTNFSIGLTQPLMKNAQGIIDKYPIKAAQIGEKLAKIRYEEELEALTLVWMEYFLNWQLSEVKTVILKKQLETATRQKEVTTLQFKRGAAEKSELVLAQQNEVSKQMLYLREKVALEEEIQKIETIIGRKVEDLSVDPKTLLIDSLIPTRSRRSSLSYQATSGNVVRMFKLSEQVQELTVSANLNQLKPDLSVFVNNQLSSAESSFSDSLGSIASDFSVQAGLSLSLPLENTLAVSNYKRALLSYNSLLKSNENSMLVLTDNINILYQQFDSISTLIVRAKALEKLAKETALLEQEKHRQGRTASLFFVLDTQNKALSAQLQVEELQFQKMHIENQLAGLNDDYLSYIKPLIKDSYVK